MLKIIVPMDAIGKQRPQTVTRGGKTVTYTPKKTVEAEAMIRREALDTGIFFERHEPVHLEVTFYRVRPKSAKKRRLPTTVPDFDNCVKLVTDALQKFAFEDDAQITTAVVRKRYDTWPRIEIKMMLDTEE